MCRCGAAPHVPTCRAPASWLPARGRPGPRPMRPPRPRPRRCRRPPGWAPTRPLPRLPLPLQAATARQGRCCSPAPLQEHPAARRAVWRGGAGAGPYAPGQLHCHTALCLAAVHIPTQPSRAGPWLVWVGHAVTTLGDCAPVAIVSTRSHETHACSRMARMHACPHSIGHGGQRAHLSRRRPCSSLIRRRCLVRRRIGLHRHLPACRARPEGTNCLWRYMHLDGIVNAIRIL